MVLQLLFSLLQGFNRESSCNYDCKRSIRTILDGTNQTSTFHKCLCNGCCNVYESLLGFCRKQICQLETICTFDKKEEKNVARNQVRYLLFNEKNTNSPIFLLVIMQLLQLLYLVMFILAVVMVFTDLHCMRQLLHGFS